jgi:hypothetical protein
MVHIRYFDVDLVMCAKTCTYILLAIIVHVDLVLCSTVTLLVLWVYEF